jgi:CheY-like chemotaxis protein
MSPERIPRKRILVVEDEPMISGLMREVLQAEGHAVDVAASGIEALGRLQERSYDLIVSDLRMPGLDGPGLYRELGRRRPDLLRRIMFVTGSALDPVNQRFLEDNRVPWLAKPFSLVDFQELIQRMLGA